MGRMSDLHAETAMDRADSAESELAELRAMIRKSAGEIQKIRDALRLAAHPNSVIATDLTNRLSDIALDLYMWGGPVAAAPVAATDVTRRRGTFWQATHDRLMSEGHGHERAAQMADARVAAVARSFRDNPLAEVES